MPTINSSDSQTPSPADMEMRIDIKHAYKIIDQHYKHVDAINNKNYKYGKIVDKNITDDHKAVLKSIIFMLVDDIKTYDDEVSTTDVEKKCRLLIDMVDLLPDMRKNTAVNKQLLAKTLGYFIKLHEMHN